MERGLVTIAIVTYNSEEYIERCLQYVLEQDYPRREIIVVDNASTDRSAAIVRKFGTAVRAIYNPKNVGFAAGQNQAIAQSQAEWILTLNPDVRLSPKFVSAMVAAGESDRAAGSICGKLLAMGSDFAIPAAPLFDSTGIYMTLNLRHFDRGSRTPDQGQYDRCEYVFGGTGAACLFRREMIDDISIDGEFFDSDFFAYREDADVAWRAQLLGWKCLYNPLAIAWHVRKVLPENRTSLPPVVNMHSVKNRWLLRIKNTTFDLYRRHWLAITARDVIVIGGCLLREWRSLRAFWLVLRYSKSAFAKRRAIMRRKRVTDAYIAAWFSKAPVSYPREQVLRAPFEGATSV
jgi:GT2 family glycosyltransferase